MTNQDRNVYAGIDTHRDAHFAAVVDWTGRLLAAKSFATSPLGYGSASIGSHDTAARWASGWRAPAPTVTLSPECSPTPGTVRSTILRKAADSTWTVVGIPAPDQSRPQVGATFGSCSH